MRQFVLKSRNAADDIVSAANLENVFGIEGAEKLEIGGDEC